MIIKKAEYIISCVEYAKAPKENGFDFVLMGRSNVGKSSFINSLCNRKNLAYTSSKPGKTLTLNYYNVNDTFYLIDFPGYGYAARTKMHRLDFGAMYEDYLEKATNLKMCFLIVDLRHAPTEDDILMYNYLKHLEKPICVIATKADKLTRNEQTKAIVLAKKTLALSESDLFIKFSSLDGTGKVEVLNLIESLCKD